MVRLACATLLYAGIVLPVAAQELSVNGTVFSVDELESEFEQHTIETITSWTGDEVISFSGPTINDVIAAVGIGSEVDIIAEAANDYSVTITREDIDLYQPILAIRQEGEPIPFEAKGPIRVVWPRSKFPEITIAKDGYWIWYLEKIVVAK